MENIQALADFQAGKPLTFPGLVITGQYISKSDKMLRWKQVEAVEADVERLMIRAKGASKAWLQMPISQFPNVGVMAKWLAHIKKTQGGDMRVEV